MNFLNDVKTRVVGYENPCTSNLHVPPGAIAIREISGDNSYQPLELRYRHYSYTPGVNYGNLFSV